MGGGRFLGGSGGRKPGCKGIKMWAEEDRPREKLMHRGRHHVSDVELLAILISSGNKEESALELSRRILGTLGNSLADLAKLNVDELLSFRGIGNAKAILILAALELGRRRSTERLGRKHRIRQSYDAYQELRPHLEHLPHEEFWVTLLNKRNEILLTELVSRGGVSSTIVDPKLLFQKVIRTGATGVILAHNHPSGSELPSSEDNRLTLKLQQAAKIMDIDIIDHIIIGSTTYYSFADQGCLSKAINYASSDNDTGGPATDN